MFPTKLPPERVGRRRFDMDDPDLHAAARRAHDLALMTWPGSLGADPIQEEIDGSFSMPFLGFRIRCDAVERETLGMPEHKIEKHVSRKLGVLHLDLATSDGLTQNFRNSSRCPQPSFLIL